MAHQFLRDDLESPEVGSELMLAGAEGKHAATITRIRIGETIRIANGRGIIAVGNVIALHSGELTVRVVDILESDRTYPAITLVQALAKGDRDELAVQSATELGVCRIVPWSAHRSVSRWEGAKIAKGCERWTSIVRDASKQSHGFWLPEVVSLHSTVKLVEFIRGRQVIVLDPNATLNLSTALADIDLTEEIVIVVGPEGGIDDVEIASFIDAGAVSVRLGDSILRTSTAAPAALSAICALTGQW